MFSSKSNLNTHLKTTKCAGENRLSYDCNYCDNKFSSKHILLNHIDTCVLKKQKENTSVIINEYKELLKNQKLEYDKIINEKDIQTQQMKHEYVGKEQIYKEIIKDLQDKLGQYTSNTTHVFNVQVDEKIQEPEPGVNPKWSAGTVPAVDLESKVNEKPLVLNEIVIPTRYIDNYVNLTEMCRAGNKKFNHWKSLEKTKEFLDELSRSAGIPADLLIKTISHGPNEQRGSWGHPQVAVNVAQWISPKFDVEVSRHILELYTTGSTEIKNFELNQQLQDKNDKIKYLENSHDKLLKKRSYHKFKEGPVFYIISDCDSKSLKCKPGIDEKSINVRLQQHRSTTPAIKLEYLIYTDKCVIIENMILEKYSTRRKFLNHEWVFDVEIEEVVTSVKTLLTFLGVDFTEETELEKYNSQIEC
jgi:hypothetical protein